jgi:hypothetical protein
VANVPPKRVGGEIRRGAVTLTRGADGEREEADGGAWLLCGLRV